MILQNCNQKKAIQINVPDELKDKLFYRFCSKKQTFYEVCSTISRPDVCYLDNETKIPLLHLSSENFKVLFYIEGTYVLKEKVPYDKNSTGYEYYLCNFISTSTLYYRRTNGINTYPFVFHKKKKVYHNGHGSYVKIDGHHNFIGQVTNYPIYTVN